MTPPNKKALGVQQRRVVELMVRYGGGYRQPSWHIKADDHRVLRTLVDRGIVEKMGEHTWKLVM